MQKTINLPQDLCMVAVNHRIPFKENRMPQQPIYTPSEVVSSREMPPSPLPSLSIQQAQDPLKTDPHAKCQVSFKSL